MGDTLARLVAHMMILGHHQQQLSRIGPEQMAQAAAKGDIDSVKQFIKLKKELVRIFPFTFTSLRKLMEHIITSHIMGHVDRNNILYSLQWLQEQKIM